MPQIIAIAAWLILCKRMPKPHSQLQHEGGKLVATLPAHSM
jgi:hypothetical protein